MDSGISYDWLVAPKQKPFQVESLEAFGVMNDRILASDALHIEAGQLIVPTLPGYTGNPPRWVCEFLRMKTIDRFSRSHPRERKIYISRWKCGTRKVLNETDLLAPLREEGFERVTLEDLSFLEQVRLFASAQFVVGAHGAGLSNLVFCAPGTRVVELFSPNYMNYAYWALANQVSLDYDYVVGDEFAGKPPQNFRVHDNIRVNIPKVLSAVRSVRPKVTQSGNEHRANMEEVAFTSAPK
jgi:capsular polysaccharide biosynthesis protein